MRKGLKSIDTNGAINNTIIKSETDINIEEIIIITNVIKI